MWGFRLWRRVQGRGAMAERAVIVLRSMTPAMMRGPEVTRPVAATRTTVRVLGVLAALTGIEHGVGEIAQGWTAPPALVFESWPHASAFVPLNGEPAMSVVPNLLVSGLLSIGVALLIGITAVRAEGPRDGTRLIGLSLALLLVGGGFGPPLLGVVIGLLALRIGATTSRRPGRLLRVVALSYPWSLALAAGCFLGLVPGTALAQLVVDGDLSALVAALTLGAFAGTAFAMWSARARDRVDDADAEPGGVLG